MAHFPSHSVYRSHSMALVSLHPSAPVQQGHLHMGIAAANTRLHCSSHGMSSLKAGCSSSIQASACGRFLAGHQHTQENSRDKEELDAKGHQSVGDVPTQNSYGFSPR